jgi:hypothetical protein
MMSYDELIGEKERKERKRRRGKKEKGRRKT